MKKFLFGLVICSICMTIPVQAAMDSKTRQWERILLQKMPSLFCDANTGKMTKIFQISSAECMRVYHYSSQQCINAVNQVSYYSVFNGATGQHWGTIIGTCIGLAYDMQYTFKRPLSLPSAPSPIQDALPRPE